jgi:hypothetical protein
MRLVMSSLLSLALLACGPSQQETSPDKAGSYTIEGGETRASITGKDGSVTTLRAGEKVPVQLPRGFSVAPGLTVVSNTHVARARGVFVLLDMKGSMPVADVIAFYRQQAEAAGVAITVDIASADSTTIAGESKDGLAFTAMASRRDGTTAVQLTVNQGLK